MLTQTVLCDRHMGDAYPPRCPACESLTREYQALNIPTYPIYQKHEEEEDHG